MKLICGLVRNLVSRVHLNRFSDFQSNKSIKKKPRLVDEQPITGCSYRTNNCGQLSVDDVGRTVKLAGWLEFRRLNKFLVLRDSYGRIQLVLKDRKFDEILDELTLESIIQVEGVVRKRPDKMINSEMSNGHIEIEIEKLQVLNKAKNNLPFNIRGFQKANEQLRMKYRYLDLRFAEMQHNLKFRSQLLHNFRKYLVDQCGFLDVETPVLFRRTHGGANEFLVESPLPAHYYALVQSPQQFKQILMAGAIDKYFQIAKCFRNETARSDRQIEFSQLDLEMAFADAVDVQHTIENMLRYAWPELVPDTGIKRITYTDAIECYGTDKPDLRSTNRIENCDEIFASVANEFRNVRALVCRCSTIDLQPLATKIVAQLPSVQLVQLKPREIERLWPREITDKLTAQLQLTDSDTVFIGYGPVKLDVLKLLGQLRLLIARPRPQQMSLLWIDQFPLFETTATQQLQAVHHPFTMIHAADLTKFSHANRTDLLTVRGQSFDLVLNGHEIGGGSVRIHNAPLQKHVFDLLGLNSVDFEHLLEALASGCPPHAGFALGIDRLLAVALGTNSIRDVIAFPKSIEGRDLMSDSPTPL